MRRSTKISIGAMVAVIVIVTLALSQPVAFAVGGSGKFNPQTQFPVGTTVTFSSLDGVAAIRSNFTKPKFTQYDASLSVTVRVENFTKDGGIRWKVLSGTFTVRGQTYTITSGDGHMNSLDEIASGMNGEATGPDGQTYRWRLHGLATLYNGVVIVSLGGGIGTIQSNDAILRYHIAFMATMN